MANVAPTSTAFAQQSQIHQRRTDPPLDCGEPDGAQDGDHQAADRRDREPAPVAALTQRQHQGDEDNRNQQRSGDVDRARTVRVAGLLDGEQRQRYACGRDGRIEPEQSLPAGGVDEHAADQRTQGGAGR